MSVTHEQLDHSHQKMEKNYRSNTLKDLLFFSKPLELVAQELSQLGWDCESPVVIFESSHAINILQRFLLGDLSKSSLEHWANLIEGREDIEYEESKRDLLKELVFRLANPVLEGEITESVCTELIIKLNQ